LTVIVSSTAQIPRADKTDSVTLYERHYNKMTLVYRRRFPFYYTLFCLTRLNNNINLVPRATHFLHIASSFFFGNVLGRYATSSTDRLLDVTRRTRRRRRLVELVCFPVLAVTSLLLFLSAKKKFMREGSI